MTNSNKEKTRNIVMFYSKFFGLYKKESRHYNLNDIDFDLKYTANEIKPVNCTSIKSDTKESSSETMSSTSISTNTKIQQASLSSESPSFLPETIVPTTHIQQDAYNCGIHAILECISSINEQTKLQYLGDNHQHQHIDQYWLKIL